MEQKPDFSFHKSERLCSKRIIDALFTGGSKSMSAFPLRVVFMPVPVEAPAPLVSILVSVSKRRFKRAVKRNRVKRQIREAYRKQKHILTSVLPTSSGQGLVVAFPGLSARPYARAEGADAVSRRWVGTSEQLPESPNKHPVEPSALGPFRQFVSPGVDCSLQVYRPCDFPHDSPIVQVYADLFTIRY